MVSSRPCVGRQAWGSTAPRSRSTGLQTSSCALRALSSHLLGELGRLSGVLSYLSLSRCEASRDQGYEPCHLRVCALTYYVVHACARSCIHSGYIQSLPYMPAPSPTPMHE